MRAPGTAQYHLTSVLEEFLTTSDQDERGSQAVTFFSFPPYSTIQNTVDTKNATVTTNCLYTN